MLQWAPPGPAPRDRRTRWSGRAAARPATRWRRPGQAVHAAGGACPPRRPWRPLRRPSRTTGYLRAAGTGRLTPGRWRWPRSPSTGGSLRCPGRESAPRTAGWQVGGVMQLFPGNAERRFGADRDRTPSGRPQDCGSAVGLIRQPVIGSGGGPARDREQQCYRGPHVAAARGEVAGRGWSEPPRHGDQEPACRAMDPVQPVGELGPAGGFDDRQRIQQDILECAVRTDCPLIGGQLALEPGPGQVHAYRGRCADRVLERRAGPGPGVRAGPCVQEQHSAIAPALLLPPHHELAAAGGGPPVHLAQLIAVPVGARHHVVLPGGGRGTGPAAALAVPTPSEGGPRQWRDRRGNDQAAVLGERVPEPPEPEGIRYPHPEWADGEVAPGAGFEGVPELAGTALLNPLKHEPAPAAHQVGNGVLAQQQ